LATTPPACERGPCCGLAFVSFPLAKAMKSRACPPFCSPLLWCLSLCSRFSTCGKAPSLAPQIRLQFFPYFRVGPISTILAPALHLRHARNRPVSLILAVPLGIGAAIFRGTRSCKKFRTRSNFFIDLLAAVPSVIYGLLGVFIVVPLMANTFSRLSNTPSFSPALSGTGLRHRFLTAGLSSPLW